MAMDDSNKSKWHFSDWSLLGWIETGIKLVGLVAAILALIMAWMGGTFTAPEGVRLIEVIVQAVLAVLILAAIADRYTEKEITAMIFVVINNIGHWGMLYALLTLPGPGSMLQVFAALMLVGDLIKLYWLRTSGFTVRGYSTSVLIGLTMVFVVGYSALLVLSFVG